MKKATPFITAVSGIATGVICLGFVLLAKRMGLELSETVSSALILGGLASMGVGAAGARYMPTKGEESK